MMRCLIGVFVVAVEDPREALAGTNTQLEAINSIIIATPTKVQFRFITEIIVIMFSILSRCLL
jgi:hypothetical protein